VREIAKNRRTRRTRSKATITWGSLTSWITPLEPVATAAQKKSVASVPNAPPLGTA
jgi:hypothetical protein